MQPCSSGVTTCRGRSPRCPTNPSPTPCSRGSSSSTRSSSSSSAAPLGAVAYTQQQQQQTAAAAAPPLPPRPVSLQASTSESPAGHQGPPLAEAVTGSFQAQGPLMPLISAICICIWGTGKAQKREPGRGVPAARSSATALEPLGAAQLQHVTCVLPQPEARCFQP